MRPGISMVQMAPGVWAHRVVCAACGVAYMWPTEEPVIEWLFTHRTPGVHAAGKPAGVLR